MRFVRPPAAIIEELKLDFPLVEPTTSGGIFANERTSFDDSKAVHAGLSYRPLSQSGNGGAPRRPRAARLPNIGGPPTKKKVILDAMSRA